MPTIKDKLYFNYDGVSSKDFGITAVDLGSGLYEETLVATRTVEETSPSGRDTSIFHGISEEDRTFDLTLAFDEGFNEGSITEVIDWLFKGYYRPMYFEENSGRIVFGIMQGDSRIVHNGLEQGYFTVSVKTNSPYIYSEIKSVSGVGDSTISVVNNGHKETYPNLKIKKTGDGDLKIGINGYNTLITNLVNGETIEIDTMREKIVTDLPGQYRYDNITIGELSDLLIEKGEQTYTITGGAEFECVYREIYRF